MVGLQYSLAHFDEIKSLSVAEKLPSAKGFIPWLKTKTLDLPSGIGHNTEASGTEKGIKVQAAEEEELWRLPPPDPSALPAMGAQPLSAPSAPGACTPLDFRNVRAAQGPKRRVQPTLQEERASVPSSQQAPPKLRRLRYASDSTLEGLRQTSTPLGGIINLRTRASLFSFPGAAAATDGQTSESASALRPSTGAPDLQPPKGRAAHHRPCTPLGPLWVGSLTFGK